MTRKQPRLLPEARVIADLPRVPESVISFDRQFIDTRGDQWLVRRIADGRDLIRMDWLRFASVGAIDRNTKTQLPSRTVHIMRLYAANRLSRRAATTVNNDIRALHSLLDWIDELEQFRTH